MANRQIIPKIMSAEEIKPTYTRPNQYSDVDFRRWYERGHTALEKTSNVPAVIYGICETYIYIYIYAVARVCSVRYRYARYRNGCAELTKVSGTSIDVPILPKCPVPVLVLYPTYRSGMKDCTGTGGTGIHIVPNLPKCPVPVWMAHRIQRSIRYRY